MIPGICLYKTLCIVTYNSSKERKKERNVYIYYLLSDFFLLLKTKCYRVLISGDMYPLTKNRIHKFCIFCISYVTFMLDLNGGDC